MMFYIIKFFKQFFILLIKAYQFIISPILGRNCRFSPTCSNYAKQSIESHGLFKGVNLSIRRLVKCHPWGKSGYDPVPD